MNGPNQITGFLQRLAEEQRALDGGFAAVHTGSAELCQIEFGLSGLRKAHEECKELVAQRLEILCGALEKACTSEADPQTVTPLLLAEFGHDLSGLLALTVRKPIESIGEKSASILGGLGAQGLSILIDVIKDNSLLYAVRRAAVLEIQKMSEDLKKRAVSAFLFVLEDSNCEIRDQAAATLLALGPAAAPAVPALLKHEFSPEIWRLGPDALPHLIDALSDDSPDIRRAAVTNIGRLGPKAHDAIPDLSRALRDPNHRVRAAAAPALVAAGANAACAVPLLVNALDDICQEVVAAAVCALHVFGPQAKPAVPALIHILSTADIWQKMDMAEAVCLTLASCGPEASQAISILAQTAITGPAEGLRVQAACALAIVDLSCQEAIPALLSVASDLSNVLHRKKVFYAFEVCFGRPDYAAELIFDCLKSKSRPQIQSAINAMSFCGDDQKPSGATIAVLANLLDRDAYYIRLSAVHRLGELLEIQVDITAALAALKQASRDIDFRLSCAARAVLDARDGRTSAGAFEHLSAPPCSLPDGAGPSSPFFTADAGRAGAATDSSQQNPADDCPNAADKVTGDEFT